MLTIHSLDNVPDDLLYEAFRDAFMDYEMQLNKGELLRILHRRGFMRQHSFGTFDGTGILKSYRRKGIGSRLLTRALSGSPGRENSMK
jgi:GNAT superfamily N-acetyltransferase